MNEVALRYGESLYSLALETDQVVAWQVEVKSLKNIIASNKEFLLVLSSEFLSMKERMDIIDRTLSSFNPNIVSFVKVICKNHRINELFDIFASYNSLANQYRGVKEGLIYSTVKLDEEKLHEIELKIGEIEHCNVELIPHVDPSLIGGIKVVINDHIYDDSISYHLKEMKNKLLRK